MLVLLIIIGILCLVFLALGQYGNFDWDVEDTLASLSMGLCGIAAFLLTWWGIATLFYNMNTKVFEQMQSTLDNARVDGLSEFERVTIQNNVIEYNEWLARAKYFNSLWINCVPDKIENLNPIK